LESSGAGRCHRRRLGDPAAAHRPVGHRHRRADCQCHRRHHRLGADNPAATTFALPSSPRIGEVHGFKYLLASGTSFALTVAAAAGQTIDGAASVSLQQPYAYLEVAYIGSNQWIAR
jgi:hypothetical protein